MITDSELSRRLDRARTDFDVPDDAIGRVLISVQAAAVRRRRRRIVRGSLMGVLVLGGGIVAPAAADVATTFLAQTGVFCAESSTECATGDEMIDLAAPDISEVVAAHYPDYLTLPPGMTAQDLTHEIQALFSGDIDGTTPDSMVQAAYEHYVYCSWVAEWLKADDASDTEARTAAADAMTASTTWPGPLQQSEVQPWQVMFAQAAQEGDADGVQTAAQFHACPSFDGTTREAWLDAHRPAEG
jgi:hypothetical protein